MALHLEIIQHLPNYFISENDEPEIVNIFTIVLLHVDSVHVHEDVSNHHHGGLVVVPGGVKGLQEVVVQGG